MCDLIVKRIVPRGVAPMQVEVTFLTRRGADAIMRKSQTVTAEAIRFGRGTDNEVQLPDIRVGLRAAILAPREAGLVVERAGDEVLRVNGEGVSTATVHPGDKISMGPYEVVIVETPSGFDAALTVELVQPLGDALERLLSQSHIGLASGGWSKRRLAWTVFCLCALFALIAPIAVYPFGTVVRSSRSVPALGSVDYVNLSWNAGSVSNPHRFFAQNCATCHRSAFAGVPDAACLSCHAGVGNHVEATAELGPSGPQLQSTRCAQCHEEHRGVHGLVIQAQALCVDCHAQLNETAPKTGTADVTGFPAGHPQFRATLVADAAKPAFARKALETKPLPEDHSGLVFSHSAHLIETGLPHAQRAQDHGLRRPATFPSRAGRDSNRSRSRRSAIPVMT